MTCKDCFHFDICQFNEQEQAVINLKSSYRDISSNIADGCKFFKNKADFVEVKRGRWETRSFIVFDSEKVGYRCSECKTTWDTKTNYCPYCGADMRKEGADNG
jgi:hypothetical protein